jgi:glycosyltransferase involved in cell wall biosynthesis
MKISILIKAYNEESRIAGAIESSLAAIADLDGEVVVADSCSRDRTVEIAMGYPVRVVRFLHEEDRGCGAGAQLAYQHSSGEYVYMLDGDMKLSPGFVKEAIRYLDDHPDISGVGGIVNDIYSENMEFRARATRSIDRVNGGELAQLDCGGLYRRSALTSVGYLADRNLHSFEEMDLGARLRADGGRLARLNVVSVDHFTHDISSYQLLWRRMTSRYSRGSGEVFKAAWGRPHFWHVVRQLKILNVVLFLLVWLLVLVTVPLFFSQPLSWLVFLILLVLPPAGMALRRRSVNMGLFATASWFVYAVGFFRGLFSPRVRASDPIPSETLREPSEPVKTAAV